MLESPTLFEARSTPLNSLDLRGFRIVSGLLILAFTFSGTVFTLMGAWPVLAFAGAETLLVIGLLASYRRHAARSLETVTLSEGRLIIRRRDGKRREEASFDPFWARLRWEETRLFVAHRGAAIEIGRFLTPEEREELEQRLGAVLRRYREPIFDNPQLR